MVESTAVQVAALRGEIAVLTQSIASMRAELSLTIKAGDGATSQKVIFLAETIHENVTRIQSLEQAVHSLELAPGEERQARFERVIVPLVTGVMGTVLGILVNHWPW